MKDISRSILFRGGFGCGIYIKNNTSEMPENIQNIPNYSYNPALSSVFENQVLHG